MVTFLSEELQSSTTKYSAKDPIPESKFTSFTPKNFIQYYGINEQTYSYLESVSEKAAYFSQVLEIYVLLRNEIELFDKQERDDSDLFFKHGKDLSVRVFYDSLYGSQLNYKEKQAANRINSGRKIYNKLTTLTNYSCLDASLGNFISETKSRLQNLPEKSIMETEYYKVVLPEEDDIFHYYLSDAKEKLENLIPDYITANSYFTNNGKALFVLSSEYYLYLVGTSRGKIPEIRKYHYFKNDYKNGFMEAIISDLRHLNEEIQQNLAFHVYNKTQENKKKKLAYYQTLSHEELINCFYEFYKVPHDFLDIIQTYPFEGKIILSKDFKIANNYQTLIISYLDGFVDNRKDMDLIKILFHIESQNPATSKAGYKNRLSNFKNFIKNYTNINNGT